MALLLRTDYFLALVAVNRVGAVKQRMYYANLAEIRLPEVPDSVQRKFAARRSKAMEEIDVANRILVDRTVRIEAMISGNRSKQAR